MIPSPQEYRSTRFIDIALSRAVVKRAARVAFVVGLVLAVINHGDTILSGTSDFGTVWRVLLTFCVPYSVSTYSSVLAVREFLAAQDGRK
mgnify:CR=1 FL=1